MDYHQDKPCDNFIPAGPQRLAGIGLRAPHYTDILSAPQTAPHIGWIEVHPENYFGGGIARDALVQARALYPLSLHAVGLSLGSDRPVDHDHLAKFKELINIYEPFQISDHISWSSFHHSFGRTQSGVDTLSSINTHIHDLLPVPYTWESLERLCRNIDQVQNYFGRKILVENPSSYIAYQNDDMSEADFMNEVACRAGCGILLDVNNIYVQSYNHGFDPQEYIKTINPAWVEEIHLAGHIERNFRSEDDPDDGRKGVEEDDSYKLMVDTHNQPVKDVVWDLYRLAIERVGMVPTLIEWDSDIPDFSVLAKEAKAAHIIMEAYENDVSK